ncbi:MmoB/DmpM family protein [Conexibacter sp. SYSU D00693]|uniref:MmoB/DmpM family protein n=1 Tax=Conexibacter sp. SYSU D00693 TaxID=2812560 RepID=UPI00196A9EF6|nr:MmoB/DmpM family protein [Conexibacter sp. SYSU D00693]
MSASPPGDAPPEAFDVVGITIARSVEGDAIADALCEQEGVEVLENASYHEVRAHGRLRLDFDELSDECGFPVDGSLIQVVMSTYYGRMVMTDDAVLIISDVHEAQAAHG